MSKSAGWNWNEFRLEFGIIPWKRIYVVLDPRRCIGHVFYFESKFPPRGPEIRNGGMHGGTCTRYGESKSRKRAFHYRLRTRVLRPLAV